MMLLGRIFKALALIGLAAILLASPGWQHDLAVAALVVGFVGLVGWRFVRKARGEEVDYKELTSEQINAPADPLSASLVGAVLFAIGVAFLVLLWFLAAPEIKTRLVPRPITIAFAAILGGVAYFCLEVGARWIFNRPSPEGAFLSAFGWGALAWMYVTSASGAFLVGWFYPELHLVETVVFCATAAAGCFLFRQLVRRASTS